MSRSDYLEWNSIISGLNWVKSDSSSIAELKWNSIVDLKKNGHTEMELFARAQLKPVHLHPPQVERGEIDDDCATLLVYPCESPSWTILMMRLFTMHLPRSFQFNGTFNMCISMSVPIPVRCIQDIQLPF